MSAAALKHHIISARCHPNIAALRRRRYVPCYGGVILLYALPDIILIMSVAALEYHNVFLRCYSEAGGEE
jgi:hypothetical protein